MSRAGWLFAVALVALAVLNRGKVVDLMSGWTQETEWDTEFAAAELANGLPAGLLKRMAWQESRFDPLAKSPVGALGLMQFMPPTWGDWGNGASIADPVAQIDAAGRYMAWLVGKLGAVDLALAAYNWGIGNMQRKGIARAPTETGNYVAQIGADVPGVLYV